MYCTVPKSQPCTVLYVVENVKGPLTVQVNSPLVVRRQVSVELLTPLDTPESSFHAGYEFSTPLGVAPGPGADAMAMPCESRLKAGELDSRGVAGRIMGRYTAHRQISRSYNV